MQVLRLLAAPRRGVPTTVTAPTTASPEYSKAADDDEEEEERDDDDDGEGSFFELDLSVRASSSSSSSSASSGSSDDASLTDLDLVISLHRSRSASPSFHFPAPPPLLKPPGAGITPSSLRTLSFARATTASARGTRSNAAPYGGRRSSFARSSGSARSLRLFMESPASPAADDEGPERDPRREPSRDVIRRYLTKISTRLRRSVRPRRLRKSRSASAAVATTTAATPPAASRRDDSLAEKQDGIASAIAHCKESLHRASLSECGLPRSRSDPGHRQAP